MMHGDSNLCSHQRAGKIDEDSISGKDKHAVVSMIRAKRHLAGALNLGVRLHAAAKAHASKKTICPPPRPIGPCVDFLQQMTKHFKAITCFLRAFVAEELRDS